MRFLQNAGLYNTYRPRLARLASACTSYTEHLEVFLADCYGACHVLGPVLERSADAFFTNGDDEGIQRAWAREHGLSATISMADILLAQLEEHRAEVFYNLDPMRFGAEFVARLPGCVKRTIAWRAAPSAGADLGAFDLLVCNFPGILRGYAAQGWRCAYFAPALDPTMEQFSAQQERPVDVVFVGGYTRHHRNRSEVLEAVAGLADRRTVMFHIDRSRPTVLAESPLGCLLPLGKYRRPKVIQQVHAEPVFGIDLYAVFSRAKIVLNGAIDMAGEDRGNMRCFEAMGCGALMVSDAGRYPAGMADGETMLTYDTPAGAAATIDGILNRPDELRAIAMRGRRSMEQHYNKRDQWSSFVELASAL